MDLLTGYESDDEQAPAAAHLNAATAAAVSAAAPHSTSAQPITPSPSFLAAAARDTIAPDHDTQLPPGLVRPEGVRTETEEEKKARKAEKKAAKAMKAEKKAAATAAAAAQPKLVLPSADALLSGLGATAMGLASPQQSGEEGDSEGGSPAPSGKPRSYNALPPPASLLAGDQLSEAEAWKLKPMDASSKKRRFVDMPAVPAAAAPAPASAPAAARPAAGGSGAAAAHARFAPPQVSRKQANVATEDTGNWNVAKRRSTPAGAAGGKAAGEAQQEGKASSSTAGES